MPWPIIVLLVFGVVWVVFGACLKIVDGIVKATRAIRRSRELARLWDDRDEETQEAVYLSLVLARGLDEMEPPA